MSSVLSMVYLVSPAVAQWVTVGLYLVAAAVWFWALRRRKALAIAWGGLLLLLLLGSDRLWWWNYELVDWVRQWAKGSGWYGGRRVYQVGGAIAVSLTALLMAAGLLLRAGRFAFPLATLLTLIAFCLVRSASHHDIDRWFVQSAAGLRIHWWIELGLLAVLILVALGMNHRGHGEHRME